MMPLIAIGLATLGAAIATLLFFYGVWKVLRTPLRKIAVATQHFIQGKKHPLALSRAIRNPVLSQSALGWEVEAVINPAAVIDPSGRVHLFYRAIGRDGISRIGYASSADGVNFDERLPYPVFALQNSVPDPRMEKYRRQHHAGLVASGGTWCGVEDPRAILLDGRVYLSFQAFEGWHSLRIGVVSISLEDLQAKRWKWSAPVFLSAPEEVQKNWVIFPKKIQGKYAVFHGLTYKNRGRALIAMLDTLDSDPTPYIDSDARFRNDELYEGVWDSRIRGAAAPPIETKEGWLVFYHANDAKEPHRYKLGAMLLDKNDPSKVLVRSQVPVLSPDASYENEGAKPGIVYACGAVVKDDMLIIYYGAADTVICAAATNLTDFVEKLLHPEIGEPQLTVTS